MSKKTDIVRINFTLNPSNDLDKEVIEAVEKLKNEGFNISARIKKLLLDDAKGVQSVRVAPTPVAVSTEPVKTESNVKEDDITEDDADNIDDGFSVDVSGLI